MKKQELIHLHGLLAEVQNHYEEQTGNKVDHKEYKKLGVQPTSIHRSKTDHKEGVFTLINEITETMGSETEAAVSTTAD